MKIRVLRVFQLMFMSGAMIMLFGGVSAMANINLGGGCDTTGPGSCNENGWEVDSEAEIKIENKAEVDNEIMVGVNTGENCIVCNAIVEDITTGDINGDIEVVTELNTADWDVNLEDIFDDVDIDLENGLTGPSGVCGICGECGYGCEEGCGNEVEIDNEVEVSIENKAEIDNDVEIYANTGENRVSDNCQVGDIETGSINVSGEIESTANTNVGSIEIPSMGGEVDIDFSNDTTGPNSSNSNSAEIEKDLEFKVENSAEIENDIDFCANTGENEIYNNAVVGDVTTGDVSFDFRVVNTAN